MSNFRKNFGTFVDLYNRVNGTSVTVKDAIRTDTMLSLYESMSKSLVDASGNIPSRGSTQSRSLALVDLEGTARRVYDFVVANPNCTRREIADGTGLLLSSVCGRVTPLLKAGHLYVSGEALDRSTGRYVETLAPASQQS